MEIEHIIPSSLGGATERENLWLACSMCNDHKGNRISAADPISSEIVRPYDPRTQLWSEHFQWNASADMILGKTPTGRATIVAIRLNRVEVVEARKSWVIAGWHPPKD